MKRMHPLLSGSILRYPVFNLGFRPLFLLVGVLPALITVTLRYFNVRADARALGISPVREGVT